MMLDDRVRGIAGVGSRTIAPTKATARRSSGALYVGCVEIRKARLDDAEMVAEVQRGAFGDRGVVVAALVDDLRGNAKSGEGLSLVAARDGRVVGHVMFSRALLDAPARLVEVQILSPVV